MSGSLANIESLLMREGKSCQYGIASYLRFEMIGQLSLESPGYLEGLEHLRIPLYLQVQVVRVHVVLKTRRQLIATVRTVIFMPSS